MTDQSVLFADWFTFEEMGARLRDRLGHGSADAIRRWKREGRLAEYGLEVRNTGRTPLVREMKTAPSG
jgi:hypothetical protein